MEKLSHCTRSNLVLGARLDVCKLFFRYSVVFQLINRFAIVFLNEKLGFITRFFDFFFLFADAYFRISLNYHICGRLCICLFNGVSQEDLLNNRICALFHKLEHSYTFRSQERLDGVVNVCFLNFLDDLTDHFFLSTWTWNIR